MATAEATEQAKTKLLSAFVDGVVCDIHAGFPSFEHKLEAKDVGIKESDVPEFVKLGHKKLVDKKSLAIFQSIIGKARREVEFYSFSLPIPGLRFCPLRVLDRLVGTLERLKLEFQDKRDEFIDRYGELKQEMLTKYAEHRQAIEALYPSKESLEGQFHFSYATFSLALPTKLQKKAVDIKTTEEARLRVNQIVDQKTRELVNGFDQWAEEIVVTARQAALELFRTIKEKVDHGEVINARSVESLKSYVENFRAMNFVGDSKMEEALAKAREILDGGMSSRFAKENAKEVLDGVIKAASSVSDVSAISGAYKRRLMETEE